MIKQNPKRVLIKHKYGIKESYLEYEDSGEKYSIEFTDKEIRKTKEIIEEKIKQLPNTFGKEKAILENHIKNSQILLEVDKSNLKIFMGHRLIKYFYPEEGWKVFIVQNRY